MFRSVCFLIAVSVVVVNGAKILAVFQVPAISHQKVFRPLTQELAKRGHEVTVITTDPAFPKGQTPANLTEIDIHDVTYSIIREQILEQRVITGKTSDAWKQISTFINTTIYLFEKQMKTQEVHNILRDPSKKFDLLIAEPTIRMTLGFSHLYKVPLIEISSHSVRYNTWNILGIPTQPILYPSIFRQKINNITFWDKITELYNQYAIESYIDSVEMKETEAIRQVFGSDAPPLNELFNNIHMLFLNIHPIWGNNRPVPPNTIYLQKLYENIQEELTKDLRSYLDTSKNGVIYVSFGSSVKPSTLSSEKIKLFVEIFSKLPYEVLWKWDEKELPGRPPNIRIAKWFPQADLLRHPKIKLFITQGGLQSTRDAISSGVPLIGIPMYADQWYNVELYERHKIGLRLDFESLTKEGLENSINIVLKDDSYRKNIYKLHSLEEQPLTPLEYAVWWTEYVLRHGGAHHMRSPAANITWAQYMELELIFYILAILIFAVLLLVSLSYYVLITIKRCLW